MTEYPIREKASTIGGYPVDVRGEKVTIGQAAPPFQLVSPNFSRKKLTDYAGKVKILSIVPSLDTPVCDLQARHFNTAAPELSEDVVVLNISADLPFAQARWLRENNAEHIELLSTHLDMQFSDDYGTHVVTSRTNQRAVIVIDADDQITYAEYVTEAGDGIDFQAAIEAAKQALEKLS